MNRRTVLELTTTALLCTGVVFSASLASAQQKSLKDELVGTWTLVSWDQTNRDGTKFQRFGANPKGISVFDPNGHFVLMMVHPDLPKIAANNPSNPTPEEAKAITGGAIGYFGTYTVDEPSKTIRLRVEGSSYPNLIGDQPRTIVSLTADELKYGNATPTTGGKIEYTFKRASPATVGVSPGRQ
jgi:hypothetical protein